MGFEYQAAIDHKLRVAVGIRLGDWVAIYRLRKRRVGGLGRHWLEKIIGMQPQLMRVQMATFEDAEVDVARLPESAFDVIGVEPGKLVSISSTTADLSSRALVLSDRAMKRRETLINRELNAYEDVRKLVRLDRLFGAGEDGEDLSPVLIDADHRQMLGIKPGDPVRIVRDCRDVFMSRIYVILFPMLIAMILVPLRFEHKSWPETLVRLGLIGVISLLPVMAVVLEARSRFRNPQ